MRVTKASFVLFIFIAVLASASLSQVQAAKKRVRAVRQAGVSYSSARLSRQTNSIILTLSNLDKTKKVNYVLSYNANGIAQGVVGSITPDGQTSDSRDLYFGTCSKGVCTPHYNITNAVLTVTTNLTNGSVFVKRYRVRV